MNYPRFLQSHHFIPSLRLTVIGVLSLILTATSGCLSKLGPHELTIQQGNVVSQKMVNKLKPGMTKRQVQFILGTPLIVDAINDNEWHYIYSLHKGQSNALKSQIGVTFVDEKLTEISGDYKPANDDTTE